MGASMGMINLVEASLSSIMYISTIDLARERNVPSRAVCTPAEMDSLFRENKAVVDVKHCELTKVGFSSKQSNGEYIFVEDGGRRAERRVGGCADVPVAVIDLAGSLCSFAIHHDEYVDR